MHMPCLDVPCYRVRWCKVTAFGVLFVGTSVISNSPYILTDGATQKKVIPNSKKFMLSKLDGISVQSSGRSSFLRSHKDFVSSQRWHCFRNMVCTRDVVCFAKRFGEGGLVKPSCDIISKTNIVAFKSMHDLRYSWESNFKCC